MSLLFDLTASQPNASGKRHGGGKYCEMIFLAMCAHGGKFKVFYDSSRYINPVILENTDKYKIPLFDISNQSLQDIVSRENITTLYSALPEQIFPWPNCKIIGTIHGLRALELPFDFFSVKQYDFGLIGLNTILAFLRNKGQKEKIKAYYQKLLNTNNFFFVTDSCHSKRVISGICSKNNIPVFFPPSTITNTHTRINQNYFLLVSANRQEKNCIRAIIALDQLYSEGLIPTSFRTKITGLTEPNFRYKIKNSDLFDFLGYIEEDELSALYANCGCFIYPSLNEGFGYPPLEAMKYNVPVIASNASSIPEVCGNAALYFNPTSISELKERIVELQDKQVYSDLQKKGAIRIQEVETRQKEDLDKLLDWIIYNST